MSIAKPKVTIDTALGGISTPFRGRLVKAYNGLKAAHVDGNFDACGLRAGRFCEVFLRWAQDELTGAHTPFGTKLANFKDDCDKLERTPKSAGHVFGKRRVLPKLSYGQQTLLLLYSSPDSAIPMEDLVSWTEHSNGTVYRRDVLTRLHKARLIEYDRDAEMVAISPKGVQKVEAELLPGA
jgi:hypothetical protein